MLNANGLLNISKRNGWIHLPGNQGKGSMKGEKQGRGQGKHRLQSIISIKGISFIGYVSNHLYGTLIFLFTFCFCSFTIELSTKEKHRSKWNNKQMKS